MKAIQEVGIKRGARFVVSLFTGWLVSIAPTPPLRAFILKLFGAKIGKDTFLLPPSFINLDRTGFSGLTIGKECYLGAEMMLDLADEIIIEDQVTFGPRVTVLTHLNVGYQDHPLQNKFPAQTRRVVIGSGSFVGAGAIIMCGVTIGAGSFVAAGSVVTSDLPPGCVVGGSPARPLTSSA